MGKKIIVNVLRFLGVIVLTAVLWLSVIALDNREIVNDLQVIFAGTQQDADCIILLNEDHCVLVDTGEQADGEHIAELLFANGVEQIDSIILTHPDQDHIGGAFYILDHFKVGQIVAPYFGGEKQLYRDLLLKLEEIRVPIQTLSRDRLYTYGDVDVRVFSPEKFYYKESNEYSLAVLVEHGENAFFLAGDAQGERIDELMKVTLPQIDVYKAARHGRDSDKGLMLLEKVCPEYAVVTAAAPERETEALLSQLGAEVYITIGQNHTFISNGKFLEIQ